MERLAAPSAEEALEVFNPLPIRHMIWLLTQALALALSTLEETIAVAGPAVKIPDGTQISLAHSILTELKPGAEKAVSRSRAQWAQGGYSPAFSSALRVSLARLADKQ